MGWCLGVAEASVDDAAVAPVQYEAQNLEVPVVIVTSEAADLGNNLGSKARIYQDILV